MKTLDSVLAERDAALAALAAAETRAAALEEALRELVEKSPLYVRSGHHGWLCWHCDGEDLLPGRDEGHAPDCPWLQARLLAGQGAARQQEG